MSKDKKKDKSPSNDLQTTAGDGGSGTAKTATSAGDAPDPIPGHRLRTVICEPDELIRNGLKAMISSTASVIAETDDGESAEEIIKSLCPDLVITDIVVPNKNGLELTEFVKTQLPSSHVIIATDSYNATKFYNRLKNVAADAIYLKSTNPDVLTDFTRRIKQNEFLCDPSVEKLIAQKPAQEIIGFNSTEIDILLRISTPNSEIAEELDIDLASIEKQIESILKKAKVPTRTALLFTVLQLGLTPLPNVPSANDEGKSEEEEKAQEYAKRALDLD